MEAEEDSVKTNRCYMKLSVCASSFDRMFNRKRKQMFTFEKLELEN